MILMTLDEILLEKSRRRVLAPGSRGSLRWWVDRFGTVRYGERPRGRTYRPTQRDDRQVRRHLNEYAKGDRVKYIRYDETKGFARDRQQELLYAAEDTVKHYFPDITKKEAEMIIAHEVPFPVHLEFNEDKTNAAFASASYVDRKNFPRGQFRRTQWAQRGKLKFHIRSGRSIQILLHEMSHLLQTRTKSEFHGSEFVATYLALVHKYVGKRAHDRLKTAFQEHGVKTKGRIFHPHVQKTLGRYLNR